MFRHNSQLNRLFLRALALCLVLFAAGHAQAKPLVGLDAGEEAGEEAGARSPDAEGFPPLTLRETETSASLTFDHACLLDATVDAAPVCAVFQEQRAADQREQRLIDGRRTAFVRAGDNPATGGPRYFLITLSSVVVAGLNGLPRAQSILKEMEKVTRSSVVSFQDDKFLRITSQFEAGASVRFLAIDHGERQLAVDFAGLKGWRAEDLEAAAAEAMKTFRRPASAARTTTPPAAPAKEDNSLGVIILFVLIGGPFILFGLRVLIRSKMRSSAEARDLAHRPGPAQLVGADCAECTETIVFERDGALCRKCGAPVHNRCSAAHGKGHR